VVGNPFQFVLDLQYVVTDEPIDVVAVLIAFALSDLWKNHLRWSNFTSCEDIISVGEGRSAPLDRMSYIATHNWHEIIPMPAKVIVAVERSNTRTPLRLCSCGHWCLGL